MATAIPELGGYVLPGGIKDPCAGLAEARTAEAIGLGALWLGERFDTKDFPAILGAASQITDSIKLGVGITPMNVRHPMVLASTGQTLQALAKGRFRFGFGRSAAWRWTGYGVPEPTLASMGDVARILRRLWAGETVSYSGPAGTFPNIWLPQISELAPPPLYLAAIGPKTLALGGGVFDGVILHPFLTQDAVHRSAQIIRKAAAARGRDPDSIRVVATVVTAPGLCEEDTMHAINARGAGYLEVKGLGDAIVQANGWNPADLAAYRNDPRLLALGGKTADKHLSRAELVELTKMMPNHWLPSSSASGTAVHCAAILRNYLAAGADEILIHGATPDQLSELVAAFGQEAAA